MNRILKYILLPLVLFAAVLFAFRHVNQLDIEIFENHPVALRFVTKFIMTISVPLIIIKLFFSNQQKEFGLKIHNSKESATLALRSYGVAGPAGITFWLIGLLGYSFLDWIGAAILSIVYIIVFLIIPKVTTVNLRKPNESLKSDLLLAILVLMGLITCLISFTVEQKPTLLLKILYYLFIVGLGEELLFRGCIQSALNQFFGKPFNLWGTKVGWGFVIASILFGLIHALTSTPPTWPWALFTAIMGFILGFVRERDDSILAAVILHGLMDLPLAFS